jgi:glycogen synthase
VKDVFICHAVEDLDDVVKPLIEAFEREKITYWYDRTEILWGESITEKVNYGLRYSSFCLVVVSSAFMTKPWPKRELFAMLNREAVNAGKVLLPLLVGSSEEQRQLHDQLALIHDMSFLSWDGDPATVIAALKSRIGRDVSVASRRVCHVSSEYPPHVYGGLGVHVEHLTKALGAHLDVDVVLPSPGQQEYRLLDERVRPHGMAKVEASYDEPTSWLRFADFASQRIIRRAREHRPDVIHCHDWVTVLAGIKCKWDLGIPLVMHLHLPNSSKLCASVENLGLICADRITVNSEAMCEELMGRRLRLLNQPLVVKNGVDSTVFRPGDNWPAEDDYLLFVGRLVEQKGVEYLLRAYQYIRTKYPTVRLKIVGAGDLDLALRRLATNLLLSDCIDFVGWKSGSELVSLYQRAAVIVVPSIYEPFGMTALEALACGRPVVASREGGLREIVKHEVHGFLAEPKDELDLAQWLMALLSDADLRSKMGKAGRDHVQRSYQWSDVANQFHVLYDELIEQSVDLSKHERSDEFVDQILGLAQEMGFESLLLRHLFDGKDLS